MDRLRLITELTEDIKNTVLQLEMVSELHLKLRMRAELRTMIDTLRKLIENLPYSE